MKNICILMMMILLVCFCNCQKTKTKPYDIFLQDNNLCLVMDHPTFGIVELNRPNWGNISLEEVILDVYTILQHRETNDEINIWIRFKNPYTDNYGNVSFTYDDYKICQIPVLEAKKYKSAQYLDQSYQITNNITKAAFDPNYKYDNGNDRIQTDMNNYIAPTDTMTLN